MDAITQVLVLLIFLFMFCFTYKVLRNSLLSMFPLPERKQTNPATIVHCRFVVLGMLMASQKPLLLTFRLLDRASRKSPLTLLFLDHRQTQDLSASVSNYSLNVL